MFGQNSISNVEQLPETVTTAPKVKPFVSDHNQTSSHVYDVYKFNGAVFASGVAFLGLLLLLVIHGHVRLAGPFLPMFLMLFHQRLEYVLRYQALGLFPIAVNVAVIYVRRFIAARADDPDDEFAARLQHTLKDSLEQFVMSLTIQMVFCANLNAEQTMVFCPFLAVTFVVGRFAYMFGYPKYHYFGLAVTFVPSLVAIVFNAYGALYFLFA